MSIFRAGVASALATACFAFVAPGSAVAAGVDAGGMAPRSTSAHVRSLQAQARRVYGPAGAYYGSLTAAQERRPEQAGKQTGVRINACQRPYQKQLFGDLRVGTNHYRVYQLYEDGALMQQYQAEVVAGGPGLAVAARAWTEITVPNAAMTAFAHAIGDELITSLDMPRLNACGFIHQLARHHFSLDWARNSADGKTAGRWMHDLQADEGRTARFWRYIQSPPARRRHLLSPQQLAKLANLPGELS